MQILSLACIKEVYWSTLCETESPHCRYDVNRVLMYCTTISLVNAADASDDRRRQSGAEIRGGSVRGY